MSWSSSLETSPTPKSYGSVSCLAMRQIAAAFKEMFSLEHVWDGGDSPEITHKAGECRVCGITDGIPTSNFIVGAIQFDSSGPTLYRDNGSVMSAISTSVHGDLTGLTDNDHPQYLTLAGGDDIGLVTLKGGLEGLSVTSGDYIDSDAASVGVHVHANGVFQALAGDAITVDKLDVVEVSLVAATGMADGDYTGDLDLGRFSFLPWLDCAFPDSPSLEILPVVKADKVNWPANYNGMANFRAIGAISSLTLKSQRWDET